MTAIKQAIVTIDEQVYIIDAFKGTVGWKYLPKVTKFILPIVLELGKSNPQEASDLTQEDVDGLDEEHIIKVLIELLSGDDIDEFTELVEDLLSNVNKNGSKINFDEEFSQNYLTLLKLVFEVIKLNYLNSFQKLATKK